MGRKPKLYVPLTVHFFEDDRIIGAGDGPTLLYIAMCLRAKALGTDGRLSETQVSRLHRPKWKAELRRLADLGLVIFDDAAREWFIAGWFSHNEPIDLRNARLAADRERKRFPAGIRAESNRNVVDFPNQSREERSKEGKSGRNPTHEFDDDGQGQCLVCLLPYRNAVHGAAS